MTREQYLSLETDPKAELTDEQRKQGWHWCADFDGMLVGPDMPEWELCTCFDGIAA